MLQSVVTDESQCLLNSLKSIKLFRFNWNLLKHGIWRQKSTLMKSWNKISDERCKYDEDTSGILVELVHKTDGCEDMTKTEISAWISSDIERDLTDQRNCKHCNKKRCELMQW